VNLHPELVPIYDALEESAWFPDYRRVRDDARRAHAARLQPPDPRLRIDDLHVDGPGGAIALRTYASLERAPSDRAVLYFHSGGYFMGSIDGDDGYCRLLALEVGALVVSCDYRLAPEHPFPAASDDGYAALLWTAQRAKRIAVAGRSAGAGLAAGLALRARDERGPAIAFASLQIPMLDDRMQTPSALAVTDARITDRAKIAGCWNAYAGTDRAALSPYAAPARADDLRGLPPTFVHVVEYDPLRDEGIAYASRLAQSGVPTELHLSPGVYHNFENVIPQSAVARRARGLWIAALQEAFA
jgi:acetyl esterase/lipase